MKAEIKERLNTLAEGEVKTSSQMLRELMRNYNKQKDISAYVDDLWSGIGRKLKSRGVKQRDIGRELKGARSSRG